MVTSFQIFYLRPFLDFVGKIDRVLEIFIRIFFDIKISGSNYDANDSKSIAKQCEFFRKFYFLPFRSFSSQNGRLPENVREYFLISAFFAL